MAFLKNSSFDKHVCKISGAYVHTKPRGTKTKSICIISGDRRPPYMHKPALHAVKTYVMVSK